MTRPISLAHSPAFCPSPLSCYPLGTPSLLGSSCRSQISKLNSLDEYAGPDCINVLTSSSRTQTQTSSDSFLSLHFMFVRRFLTTKLPHWLGLSGLEVGTWKAQNWTEKNKGRECPPFGSVISYLFEQGATGLLLTCIGGLQSTADGWARHAIHNSCSEHLHYN